MNRWAKALVFGVGWGVMSFVVNPELFVFIAASLAGLSFGCFLVVIAPRQETP